MKVTVKPKDKLTGLPYPKLMLNEKDSMIVLFRSKGRGMVLYSKGVYAKGFYSEQWDTFGLDFIDYIGVITIQQ